MPLRCLLSPLLFFMLFSSLNIAKGQPRGGSYEGTPVDSSPSQTACISLQGNGPRFMTLIAESAALLESDLYPRVMSGGSSAAFAIPAVQATLANPSIRRASIYDTDGTPLTLSQKAALVLAATGPIGESILMLPSLNRLGTTVANTIRFLGLATLARSLPENLNSHIGNMEASLGQGLLFIDFFTSSDFTDALEAPTPAMRNKILFEKWTRFADLVLVTPAEFVRALITAPESPHSTPRGQEIKRRYFALFRAENTRPDQTPEATLVRYNRLLSTHAATLDRIPDGPLLAAYMNTLRAVEHAPILGYVVQTVMKPFYLPSPDALWRAYKGFSVTRKPLVLPSGSLIHSTARLARQSPNGQIRQQPGIDNLFQLYFPSSDLYEELRRARDARPSGRGFLEFPDDTGWHTVVPVKRTLVLGPRPMTEVIRASIGEPGALARGPVTLSPAERQSYGQTWASDEGLVSYGGWLAHVENHTMAQIKQCATADFFVDISTLNDGLRLFQEMAARPLFEGGWAAVGRNLAWLLGLQRHDPVQAWLDGAWKSYAHARTTQGRVGHITLPFSWDNASGLEGAAARTANLLFEGTTGAFFLRAYQDAAFHLRDVDGLRARDGLEMLRGRLTRIDLRHATTEEEMRRLTEILLGE